MDSEQLKEFLSDFGLAMDLEDLIFCQEYFEGETNRNEIV